MDCKKAKLYYYEFLEAESSVPAQVSEHLSQCKHCAGEIKRLREALERPSQPAQSLEPEFLQLHYRLLDQWVACDTVMPLLPSLLAATFSANNPTPVTAHLEKCPRCRENLEKITALQLNGTQLMSASRYLAGEGEDAAGLSSDQQQTLEQIKVQCGEGVQTRMSLEQPFADASEAAWVSDAYTVDVKGRAVKVTPRAKRNRLLIPACATGTIAAAVLFVIMLTLSPTVVEALDLTTVYKSLETVNNVHIRTFSQDLKEVQSIWISESLKARIFKQAGETVFWDELTGEVIRKEANSAQFISPLNSDAKLARPWGLLPFNHISELPADKQWTYIEDTVINAVPVQVYELTWQESSGSISIQKKWRGYLDIQTHLPYRIEWSEKVGENYPETRWDTEVTYPTDDQFQEILQQHGFRLTFYGAQTDLWVMTP